MQAGLDPNEILSKLIKVSDVIKTLPEEVIILKSLPETTFGRNNECTVVIDDKTVSKVHCKLRNVYTRSQLLADSVGGGNVIAGIRNHLAVKDCSSFGTFVNNVKVGKDATELRLLLENDILTFRRPRDDSPGDYKVHYAPQFAMMGDEVILSEEQVAAYQKLQEQTQQQQLAQNGGYADWSQYPKIFIPAPLAGMVIGRGGENIKKICDETGASLEISRDRGDITEDNLKPVNVVGGSVEQVQHAKQMIEELVQQIQAGKDGSGGYGKDGGKGKGKYGKDHKGKGKFGKGGFGKENDYNSQQYGGYDKGQGKGQQQMQQQPPQEQPQPVELPPEFSQLLAPVQGAAHIIAPSEFISVILGRNNENLQQLKESTGADINIGVGPTGDNNTRVVQIVGEPPNIEHCRGLVEQLLADAKNKKQSQQQQGQWGGDQQQQQQNQENDDPMNGGNNNNDSGLAPENDPMVQPITDANGNITFEKKIPFDLVGLVVGSGGSTIKGIISDTGCHVEIDKHRGEQYVTKIIVFNSQDQKCIDEAVSRVNDILNPMMSKNSGGDHQGDVAMGSPSDIPNFVPFEPKPSETMEQEPNDDNPNEMIWKDYFPIEADLVKFVIGKHGDMIMKIGEMTGTSIQIVKQGEEHGCLIRGLTSEVVQSARHEVERNLHEGRQRLDQEEGQGNKGNNNKAKGKKGKGKRDNNDQGGFGGDQNDQGFGGDDNMGMDGQNNRKGKGKKGKKGKNQRQDKQTVQQIRNTLQPGEESRKIYIDELDFPRRQVQACDIVPSEREIFVKNMKKDCKEENLWTTLCGLGAKDVSEILLIKDQNDASKGMAYVLFQTQEQAQLAIQRLSQRPIAPEAVDISDQASGAGIFAAWSESERVLGGKEGTYHEEVLGKLMGKQAARMQDIQTQTGCRKAHLTGKGMQGFQVVDDDARLHLVLFCREGEADAIYEKALPIWTEQVGYAMINRKGGGQGMTKNGVFVPPHANQQPQSLGYGPPIGPPPGMMGQQQMGMGQQGPPGPGGPIVINVPGAQPPPGTKVIQVGGPNGQPLVGVGPNGQPLSQPTIIQTVPAGFPTEPNIKIPLLFKRTDMDSDKHTEAVALCGHELRWQPWCKDIGGKHWKSYPLRWGKGGELFVILQNTQSGQIKLVVVDEKNAMEGWKVIVAPPLEMFSAKDCKFMPFTIAGDSYLICLDKAHAKVIIYNIKDPSEAWVKMYDEKLNRADKPKSMMFSEHARLKVVYCPKTRHPYVLVHDRTMSGRQTKVWHTPKLYKIAEAKEPWEEIKDIELPIPSSHFRLWPVYSRTSNEMVPAGIAGANPLPKLESFLFLVDTESKELSVIYIPREGIEQQWHIVTRKSVPADLRLSMIYISGKSEPMAIGLSKSKNEAGLYKVHLQCVTPQFGKRGDEIPPPNRPVLDEAFKRSLDDLYVGHPAFPTPKDDEVDSKRRKASRVTVTPVDTSADLPCSPVHPWMQYPIKDVPNLDFIHAQNMNPGAGPFNANPMVMNMQAANPNMIQQQPQLQQQNSAGNQNQQQPPVQLQNQNPFGLQQGEKEPDAPAPDLPQIIPSPQGPFTMNNQQQPGQPQVVRSSTKQLNAAAGENEQSSKESGPFGSSEDGEQGGENKDSNQKDGDNNNKQSGEEGPFGGPGDSGKLENQSSVASVDGPFGSGAGADDNGKKEPAGPFGGADKKDQEPDPTTSLPQESPFGGTNEPAASPFGSGEPKASPFGNNSSTTATGGGSSSSSSSSPTTGPQDANKNNAAGANPNNPNAANPAVVQLQPANGTMPGQMPGMGQPNMMMVKGANGMMQPMQMGPNGQPMPLMMIGPNGMPMPMPMNMAMNMGMGPMGGGKGGMMGMGGPHMGGGKGGKGAFGGAPMQAQNPQANLNLTPAAAAAFALNAYKTGDSVESNWKRKGKYYPAKVICAYPGDVYDVQYVDDGTVDYKVWKSNLRQRELRHADEVNWHGPKDQIAVEIPYCGIVIGRKGETIKKIEEAHELKICVSSDSTGAPDQNHRLIFILGKTEEQCTAGKLKIQDIVAAAEAVEREKAEKIRKRDESRERYEAERRRKEEEKKRKKRRPSRSVEREHDSNNNEQSNENDQQQNWNNNDQGNNNSSSNYIADENEDRENRDSDRHGDRKRRRVSRERRGDRDREGRSGRDRDRDGGDRERKDRDRDGHRDRDRDGENNSNREHRDRDRDRRGGGGGDREERRERDRDRDGGNRRDRDRRDRRGGSDEDGGGGNQQKKLVLKSRDEKRRGDRRSRSRDRRRWR